MFNKTLIDNIEYFDKTLINNKCQNIGISPYNLTKDFNTFKSLTETLIPNNIIELISSFIIPILKINYFVDKIKNIKLNTDKYFKITISANILIDFYNNEIENKLFESKISDIKTADFFINKFIIFDKSKTEFGFKYEIIEFIFKYIINFIELTIKNLQQYESVLVDTYKMETRYNLLVNEEPLNIYSYTKKLKEELKRIRNERFDKEHGRNIKNRSYSNDYFFNNYEELNKFIIDYKTFLKLHSKKITRIIGKNISKNNKDKEYNEYIESIKKQNWGYEEDLLKLFYEKKSINPNIDSTEVVYILANNVFDLNYFDKIEDDDDTYNPYKAMKKDIKTKLKSGKNIIINNTNFSIPDSIYDKAFIDLINLIIDIRLIPLFSSILNNIHENLKNYK